MILANHVTRIAIGQLLQETNSLNPILTRREDFELYGLVGGDAVVARYGDVGELAGFAAFPEQVGQGQVEWHGLLRAVAWSGGPLVEGLLEELIDGMTAPLRAATVDGVLLSLHGAQSAVDEPDVSGRMLQAVRAAVGPDVPIAATLDLHANLTPLMAQCADVLVGYHTFPHVDHVSCGRRAARCLARMLGDGTRPAVRLFKIPMVVNSEGRATDHGVQADLWRRIVAAEDRPDVDSVGLYPVQPWLDAPWLGWTFYQAYLREAPFDDGAIGQDCWDTRRHRDIDYVAPDALIDAARAIAGGPVAVSEGHDSTNSGAPGDSTLLLAAMVHQEIGEGGGLCFCVDPEAVDHCIQAGEGARVSLSVGGKRDPSSEPLPVEGTVEAVGELRYTLSGHGGHNLPVDMGRMARLRVRDTTIVLVEQTGPGSSPQLYEAAGADPRAVKIVLAKSPEGFRADYEPFSAGILYAAAPGCATPFIDQFELAASHRPVFPQDDLEEASEATWAGLIYERQVRS